MPEVKLFEKCRDCLKWVMLFLVVAFFLYGSVCSGIVHRRCVQAGYDAGFWTIPESYCVVEVRMPYPGD